MNISMHILIIRIRGIFLEPNSHDAQITRPDTSSYRSTRKRLASGSNDASVRVRVTRVRDRFWQGTGFESVWIFRLGSRAAARETNSSTIVATSRSRPCDAPDPGTSRRLTLRVRFESRSRSGRRLMWPPCASTDFLQPRFVSRNRQLDRIAIVVVVVVLARNHGRPTQVTVAFVRLTRGTTPRRLIGWGH